MSHSDNSFAIARKRMIQEQILGRGISDTRIIQVMSELPRHLFVEEAMKNQAYTDGPLSIGEGQTISQPYIVALMTEALDLTGNEKILEIGTGCGYQTAILAKLSKQIYTIERIKSLGMEARGRFKTLGLKNIVLRIGDGSRGWQEAEPFDRILLACVAPNILKNLLQQLSPNGKMVLPVVLKEGTQNLVRISKQGKSYKTEDLGECRFVKLIGKHGYRS